MKIIDLFLVRKLQFIDSNTWRWNGKDFKRRKKLNLVDVIGFTALAIVGIPACIAGAGLVLAIAWRLCQLGYMIFWAIFTGHQI